jgi:hypothetical protein
MSFASLLVIVFARPVIAIAQRSCMQITAKRIRIMISSTPRDSTFSSIIQSGADALTVVLTLGLSLKSPVVVRFDHVASAIVNANHGIM